MSWAAWYYRRLRHERPFFSWPSVSAQQVEATVLPYVSSLSRDGSALRSAKVGGGFVGGSQRGHLGNSDGRCSGEYARPRCGGRLSWPHRFGPRLLLGLSLLFRPALRLGLHSTSSVARSAVVSAPWMGESQVNMAAHRHALIGGLQNQVQSRSAGQRPVGGFGARRKIFVKCTKVKRTNLGSI